MGGIGVSWWSVKLLEVVIRREVVGGNVVGGNLLGVKSFERTNFGWWKSLDVKLMECKLLDEIVLVELHWR